MAYFTLKSEIMLGRSKPRPCPDRLDSPIIHARQRMILEKGGYVSTLSRHMSGRSGLATETKLNHKIIGQMELQLGTLGGDELVRVLLHVLVVFSRHEGLERSINDFA
jgi:hypothetical protein